MGQDEPDLLALAAAFEPQTEGLSRPPSVLDVVAAELARDGIAVAELRALQVEYEVISRPPGLLRRLSAKAREIAKQQWGHLVGELRESREAVTLIAARVRGDRELSTEERASIRAQLLDLVKVFPAGLIAAANTALPVPGTSVFTPWILCRLGLMPSRWREAHLLDRLQQQQAKLRAEGHAAEAEQLEAFRIQLVHECEEREALSTRCRILTHWDKNGNGEWDPEERDAYAAEVVRVRNLAKRHRSSKRWYFEYEGEVYGAHPLSEVDIRRGAGMLVCFDGKTGWVALTDLLTDDDDDGRLSIDGIKRPDEVGPIGDSDIDRIDDFDRFEDDHADDLDNNNNDLNADEHAHIDDLTHEVEHHE
ncbi:MAG: hypothetical protein ACPG77_01815 [Nannocystaceae bacterium]